MMTPIRVAFVAAAALAGACGGKLPETRYYQLAPPAAKPAGGSDVLVLDVLSADAAYDDDRIVYRTTPFRFDYYQYQRWSSAPGIMVGNYLEQAFETSGKFRAVVREMTPEAPIVLAGRVVAIEEVDRSKTDWVGRVVLELSVTDARSNEVLWTAQLEEIEPLREQTPEGLAAALSIAMSRIAAHTIPVVANLSEQQARLRTEHPATAANRPRR